MDIVECGLKIDRNHGIPLLLGHAEHQTVFGDTCVIHENIYTAEICLYLLHGLFRSGEISCIGCISLAFYTVSRDLFFCFFTILIDNKIRECDVTPFGCVFQGNLFADSSCSACYNRCLSFKKFHKYCC